MNDRGALLAASYGNPTRNWGAAALDPGAPTSTPQARDRVCTSFVLFSWLEIKYYDASYKSSAPCTSGHDPSIACTESSTSL